MGTYTTNYNLFMPTIGEQGWGTLVNGNFSTIDSTMKSIDTRLTAVENEVNGALSCTSVTTSGKITGNGGIGTTSLTTSSTITSTGLITGNGGFKGNLTGNVTGNVTGNISGVISRAMTVVTTTPYTNNNITIYTTPELKGSRVTGTTWTDKSVTIAALKTSYTTPWGTYTLSRPTALSVKFTVTINSQNSAVGTVYFDGTQKFSSSSNGSFTVSLNTTTTHTLKLNISTLGTVTVSAVPLYLK